MESKYIFGRLREFVAYKAELANVLQKYPLWSEVPYDIIHKQIMTKCTYVHTESLGYETLMNFYIVVLNEGMLDVNATVAMNLLNEIKGFVRLQSFSHTFKKCVSHHFVPDTVITKMLEELVEKYPKIFIKSDEGKIWTSISYLVERIRIIARAQPGVRILCLFHLFEETFGETLQLPQMYNSESGITEMTLKSLQDIEDMLPLPPLCGLLKQFDFYLLSFNDGYLRVFESEKDFSQHCIDRMLQRELKTSKSTYGVDVIMSVFKGAAFNDYLLRTSHHLPFATNWGKKKAEIIETYKDYTLKEIVMDLSLKRVSEFAEGLCAEHAHYLMTDQSGNQMELDDEFIELRGKPCSRIIYYKHLESLGRNMKSLLEQHKGFREKKKLIEDYEDEIGPTSMFHYYIWSFLAAKGIIVQHIHGADYFICREFLHRNRETTLRLTDKDPEMVVINSFNNNANIEIPPSIDLNTELETVNELTEKLSFDQLKTNLELLYQEYLPHDEECIRMGLPDMTVHLDTQISQKQVFLVPLKNLFDCYFAEREGDAVCNARKILEVMIVRSGSLCLITERDQHLVDVLATQLLKFRNKPITFSSGQPILIEGGFYSFRLCLEAARRHPERFSISKNEKIIQTKPFTMFPSNVFVSKRLGPELSLNSLPYTYYERYGSTVDFYYPSYRGDLPDELHEDFLTDFHVYYCVPILYSRFLQSHDNLDIIEMRNVSICKMLNPPPKEALKIQIINELRHICERKIAGSKEPFYCTFSEPMTVSAFEQATGIQVNEGDLSIDITQIDHKDFVLKILDNFPTGVAFDYLHEILDRSFFVQEPYSDKIEKLKKFFGNDVYIYRNFDLMLCKKSFILEAIERVERQLITAREKVPLQHYVKIGNSRILLPEWLKFLVKPSNVERLLFTASTDSIREPLKGDTELGDAKNLRNDDNRLRSNLLELLAENCYGISINHIHKAYLKKFNNSPEFGCSALMYFQQTDEFKIIVDEITQEQFVTLPTELTKEMKNLVNLLEIYPDGIDSMELSSLYVDEYKEHLIHSPYKTLNEFLESLKFLEFVEFPPFTIIRLKTFQKKSVDFWNFERNVTTVLQQANTELSYIVLCGRYKKKFNQNIPSSRQFGHQSTFKAFKVSQFIRTKCAHHELNVSLQIKKDLRMQNDLAKICVEELLRTHQCLSYENTEKLFSQEYRLTLCKNIIKSSSRLVWYKHCGAKMVRLKGTNLKPSKTDLEPLIISLAVNGPQQLTDLFNRTHFDLNQFGSISAKEFCGYFEDVFKIEKGWVMLFPKCIPDFLFEKIKDLQERDASKINSRFKECHGYEINPKYLSFENWNEILDSIYVDEKRDKQRTHEFPVAEDEFFKNIAILLKKTGRLHFPEELLERYQEEYNQEPLMDNPEELLLTIANRLRVRIRTSGSGGILLEAWNEWSPSEETLIHNPVMEGELKSISNEDLHAAGITWDTEMEKDPHFYCHSPLSARSEVNHIENLADFIDDLLSSDE